MTLFTVTFIVSVLVFGLVAAVYFLSAGQGGESSDSTHAGAPEAKTADSMNILLIIKPEEEDRRKDLYILTRYDFKDKTVPVISLPRNSVCAVGGVSRTLTEHFDYGGLVQLKTAVQALYKTSVHRTMEMSAETFENIIDKFGGLAFDVPKDAELDGGDSLVNIETGYQTLTGVMAGQLMLWAANDPQDLMPARLISAFHNQYLSAETLQNAQSLYEYVSGQTKTDFSYADLVRILPDMELIAPFESPSEAMPVSGNEQSGGFSPDETMLAAVQNRFGGADTPIVSGVS
ncbi:MAG TPA: hypothetical protein DEQ02_04130 [Ruminococcaceae bacterium]|nr:hypothetical protein [Oscillospiraceae bacterium]